MSRVRGWCPTAWTPMEAGDGLLLRVRPRLGRLSPDQARTLAALSQRHGNGLIDLTNRAALQLRGLTRQALAPALAGLVEAGLVAPDPDREARALLVAPDWRAGDDTHRLATAWLDRLGELPPLPPKLGIAIDAGAASCLVDDPADFRIERGATGALILRADGHSCGAALVPGGEIDALIALLHWFVESGGASAGRMARHRAPLPAWAAGGARPARTPPPRIGAHPLGASVGLPFGRITADAFAGLADLAGVTGLRLTPWRMMLVEGVAPAAHGLPPADPGLLGVDACVGAPACPQATIETRALAAALAPLARRGLHVSGCAKGCARHLPAGLMVTGRGGRLDLAYDARAGDPPALAGLTPEQLIAHLESAAYGS